MVINISYWEGSGALIAKAEQKVMLERKRERERERERDLAMAVHSRERNDYYIFGSIS